MRDSFAPNLQHLIYYSKNLGTGLDLITKFNPRTCRFDESAPRAHEAGGKYGQGIIGRRYTMGQTIDVEIDIRYVLNHNDRS